MQNIAWVTFLRHLPPTLQEGLAVKTRSGTEVSIQTVLRIDHEFFVFKGRLAGTQDMGRVFFVPYDQIDHLYYQKEVREEDFNAAFDTLQMPKPGDATVDVREETDEPIVEESVAEPAPAPNRPTPVPIKSAVLERFRSRASSNPGTTIRPAQG